MVIREEICAAEEKMNAARAALLNCVDQLNKDPDTHKRLLADLNAAIEEFLIIVRERLKEL